MEVSSVTTAINGTVTDMVSGLGTITGFWFMPYVIGAFAVAVLVGLVAGFFGRRSRGRRRRGN